MAATPGGEPDRTQAAAAQGEAAPGASGSAPGLASGLAPGVAVVLAGGKSRRLGRDKAAVVVDGQPMLARMVRLAGNFCPAVAVSGRDPAPLVQGVPWFLDAQTGLGPLGGIVTALERYGTACLVLSCDLPLLDSATLEILLAAWRSRPKHAVMTTFQQIETGFIEALVAIYEPQAAPLLRRASEEGCRKLSRAIPAALRHVVMYSTADARPFFNVNTPADLASVLD
ncbi:MAG: molybdenum cofactor guanylyltransferase [Acidobacteriota bacterium]